MNKVPAVLVLAAVIVAVALGVPHAVSRAQGDAPIAPGPAERVLYAPRTGGELYEGAACRCEVAGTFSMRCGCHLADGRIEALAPNAGVTVQNLGAETTAVMAVYFAAPEAIGATGCATCTYATRACGIVAPGSTFTFPPYQMDFGPSPVDFAHGPITASVGSSMVLYSLNRRAARAYGEEWAAWLREHGRPADTPLDMFACPPIVAGWMDFSTPTPAVAGATDVAIARASTRRSAPAASATQGDVLDDCDWYAAFHAAYTGGGDGLLPGTPLPIAPLRGEPIAGVVTVLDRADDPSHPVLDRYATVPLSETLGVTAGGGGGAYTYFAPGGYGPTMDGNHSVLDVQNASAACASVTVTAHRNNRGPVELPVALRVPPGGRVRLDVGARWPDLIEMTALRIWSDEPVAAALTTRNFATSATSTALRARAGSTRWLVPRAWQELRRAALATTAAAPAALAEGWESNVAIFNPTAAQRPVTLRMQAAGEPPRGPIDYPVEPLSQLVLQPGFGLGLPGGPGWMELSSAVPPMAVAVEGLREPPNMPGLIVEAWAAPAWPDEAGAGAARAIALPDLGGPAVGGVSPEEILTRTVTMTDSLTARIAVQNPYTRTARVAIDSYAAACGYVGSIERAIDPRQTIVLSPGDLPGTAFGADSVVVRVLAGRAAAMVEIARPSWDPVDMADLPLDLTSAYAGAPMAAAWSPPTLVTATLAVSPTEIVVEYADVVGPVDRSVLVTDLSHSGRCLSFEAASSASWLSVEPSVGAWPGAMRLKVDPRTAPRLFAAGAAEAEVKVWAREAFVRANPATVRVTARWLGASTPLFIPSAATGSRTAQ